MDTTTEAMDTSGGDSGQLQRSLEESVPVDGIELFSRQIQSLQDQTTELVGELEVKNGQISEVNERNFELIKENELLKCNLSNEQELNAAYQAEIQQLRKVVEGYKNGGDEPKEEGDPQRDALVEQLHTKTLAYQRHSKEQLLENIENVLRLKQNINEVAVLKEKSQHSAKFMASKDEYISLLLRYIRELKENFARLQASYTAEIEAQSQLIAKADEENIEIRKAKEGLETELATAKSTITKLSESLIRLQEEANELREAGTRTAEDFATERQSYKEEIEKLNDLLKRSKNEIVDQYIEKLYPQIGPLCAMFDRNVGSISQLYSMYLEERRQREDAKIEKDVLAERLALLNSELETTRATAERYAEQIAALQKQQERIYGLENDNREANVALRFYQESAQNLYKSSKAFNENFQALSEKIQHLAQQTNAGTEDTTGVMALRYIMELQSKFQDFSRQQSEFEKGKLELLNEKRQLIETDSQIEALRSQVELLEMEKGNVSRQYTLLLREYEMLQSLMKSAKDSAEEESSRLQRANGELTEKVLRLSAEMEVLKAAEAEAKQNNVQSEQQRKELEMKLSSATKEADFVQQRLAMQKSFLGQMEKSLEQLRRQNGGLVALNSKLMGSLGVLPQVMPTVVTSAKAVDEVKSAQEEQQMEVQMVAKENADEVQKQVEVGELRRRIDQLQGRIAEMVTSRMKTEAEYADKLGRSQADYRTLQEEYKQLNGLYEKVNGLNQQLTEEVGTIREAMLTDPAYLSKRDQLVELATLNGLIDSLHTENRLLKIKYQTFASKEARLKSEITGLRDSVTMLEDCLKKEAEAVTQVKKYYADVDAKEAIVEETMKQLRAEKERLERECIEMRQRIGVLEEQQEGLAEVERMQAELNQNKAEIEALKGTLASRSNEIDQLNAQLKTEVEQKQKLEVDLKELTAKNDAQTNQLEALQRDLASRGSISQKHLAEMNTLKASLAVAQEFKANIQKKMNEQEAKTASLTTTTNQLRTLARRYKNQAEELEKQLAAAKANIAPTPTVPPPQPTKEDSQLVELRAKLAENETKITELEGQIASLQGEYETAKQELARLTAENEVLQQEKYEANEKAKRMAVAAQRMRELQQAGLQKDLEIAQLRARQHQQQQQMDFDQHQPSTSKASTFGSTFSNNNSKLPTSSTTYSSTSSSTGAHRASSSFFDSANSNIQPSSSSNEDIIHTHHHQPFDSLQSAQITSHSTSDDNSSEMASSLFPTSRGSNIGQIADSNVSSNKRGYSSDSDPGGLLKKAKGSRREQRQQQEVEEEEEEEEEENSNPSVEVNSEDSNDVSAAGSSSYHPLNVETNEESIESADNGRPEEGHGEEEEEDVEDEEVNVDGLDEPTDDGGLGSSVDAVASGAASSSHIPATAHRPSSISFHSHHDLASTSTASSIIDLTQSSSSSSTSPHPSSIASTSIAFHTLTSHSTRPDNSTPEDDEAIIQQRPVPLLHRQQPQQQHYLHPNAPRLFIPSSGHLLSPHNPLSSGPSFVGEEGDGLVPSTPVLYAPPRYEDSVISPQVPQSRFLFSSGANNNSTVGTSSNSTTPTISETVSSVITIDEAVGDFDSNSPRPTEGGGDGGEQEEEEAQSSALPTSSDSTASTSTGDVDANQQEQQQQQQQQRTSGTRVRKLRIRGSSRGRGSG